MHLCCVFFSQVPLLKMAWRSSCCNPFSKPCHAKIERSLRTVTKEMCEKHPDLDLQLEDKVCDSCKKHFDRKAYLEE